MLFFSSNQQLMASLVKCLKAVADSYNPAILDTTIPSTLFSSLVKLLAVKDPSKDMAYYPSLLLCTIILKFFAGTQLEVTRLWHQLIDQHQNKGKIPLHT